VSRAQTISVFDGASETTRAGSLSSDTSRPASSVRVSGKADGWFADGAALEAGLGDGSEVAAGGEDAQADSSTATRNGVARRGCGVM
jgi:hypothetical protein